MSLPQDIVVSQVSGRLDSVIFREGAESGLHEAEKKLLLERLKTEKSLLQTPSFIQLLEHALYVADNKYNREPTYIGIKNCIYDCMR